MHETNNHNSNQLLKTNINNTSNFIEFDGMNTIQNLDLLFKDVQDGIIVLKDQTIVYCNTGFANIIGCSVADAINISLNDLITPKHLDFVNKINAGKNIGKTIPSVYEIELFTKNKSKIIPVNLSYSKINFGKDKLELVIVRDLREKIEKEALIQREIHLHKYFMDSIPDSIYFKDIDSKFIKANNATVIKMGHNSVEELIGKTDFDIFRDEHALKAKKDEEEIIKNRSSIINKIEKEIWKDGKITWVTTTKIPLLDENDNVCGTFGITRDVTELKKAQDINEVLFKISSAVTSLKNIDELYHSIHNSISELMKTENFYIAIYHPETDTVSFPYFVDTVDEPPVERKTARGLTEYVLRTGKAQLINAELDIILREKGETSLIGEPTQIWLGVPLIVEGKTIGALVVQDYSNPNTYGKEEEEILTYVSEQIALAIDKKQNEEKIIRFSEELKESNASKDKFFSIIAHDLKSPFHGLLGLTRMIVEEYESLDEQEVKFYLQTIRESTESTYRLIENLLEWSRLETGKIKYNPAVLNMFMVVEDTRTLLNQLARLKNITIRNKIGYQSYVWGDVTLLQSLMQNLVSNAIKFTPAGGNIEVTEIQFDDHFEFTVSDSGVGIKAEDIPKLFRIDMSYSTKGTNQETGTGLGLALCKEIISLHNGKIIITSQVGNGTQITFSLFKPLNY
jgi:PAS domain S-box-containing protein